MVLKILGIALGIWLAFTIIGALTNLLVWALIIGAVVFVGAGVYSAVRGRSQRSIGS